VAGYHYSTAIYLSAKQTSMLGRIVDFGYANGYRPDEIQLAVGQAFYESSLGTMEHNSTTTKPVGLFQYESDTWNREHRARDIHSTDDQIAAAFQDIRQGEADYEAGQASGTIPKDVFFSEYFSMTHHSGPRHAANQHYGLDSGKWKSDHRVREYARRAAILDFEF
jgi:hypothetical protein